MYFKIDIFLYVMYIFEANSLSYYAQCTNGILLPFILWNLNFM